MGIPGNFQSGIPAGIPRSISGNGEQETPLPSLIISHSFNVVVGTLVYFHFTNKKLKIWNSWEFEVGNSCLNSREQGTGNSLARHCKYLHMKDPSRCGRACCYFWSQAKGKNLELELKIFFHHVQHLVSSSAESKRGHNDSLT